MKFRPLPLAVCALPLLAILVLVKPSPTPAPSSASSRFVTIPSGRNHSSPTSVALPVGKESVRDIPVKRAAEETDAIMEEINDAATQYQASSVDLIRPHLLDPDPEIRSHAREAMLELGEPGAVPYLRQAAQKSTSSEEKTALQAAADLLSLPSWSDTTEAGEYTPDLNPTTDQTTSP